MDKYDLFRILQCTILTFENVPELELNKHFNFNEMDKAREILELIKRENPQKFKIKNQN